MTNKEKVLSRNCNEVSYRCMNSCAQLAIARELANKTDTVQLLSGDGIWRKATTYPPLPGLVYRINPETVVTTQVLYKLTDSNGKTMNDTQWGPDVSHSGIGYGQLCSNGWIHAYEHALLGVFMNPIQAGFVGPRMWKAEGEIRLRDGPFKCGCKTLTTLYEIPVPVVTPEQRVRFAILCAKAVYKDPLWNAWADEWLAHGHTTISSVEASAKAGRVANCTGNSNEAYAAYAASYAADAAREIGSRASASDAASAALYAFEADGSLDIPALAEQAMKGEIK